MSFSSSLSSKGEYWIFLIIKAGIKDVLDNFSFVQEPRSQLRLASFDFHLLRHKNAGWS